MIFLHDKQHLHDKIVKKKILVTPFITTSVFG